MTRVLVVDDRLENLYLLRALLQGHGHTVDEARHGAEALVRARQTRPDLIISDLLMPVMDGYTLLRHWKADERLNTIPFVVYTATYTDPKDEQLALDLGADAFILKPAEPVSFMARIEAVIARDTSSPIAPPREPVGDEAGQLKEYNEVLVRKLEQKASELEQANLALRKDIARREQAEADLRRQADETTRARVALLGILEDQRQAEAALRVSEERFRLAASTGDVWDWNFETRKVSFPLDFWRRLGIDGPESANTAALFESILHPDDLARARQAVEDHIRLRLPYELEFRALAASGGME